MKKLIEKYGEVDEVQYLNTRPTEQAAGTQGGKMKGQQTENLSRTEEERKQIEQDREEERQEHWEEDGEDIEAMEGD